MQLIGVEGQTPTTHFPFSQDVISVIQNINTLTRSADWDVPKKMGMNASQMIQVVYMVNPIGLASLKVSGTPRVLIA